MRRAGWAAICCGINGAIAGCAISFPDYPEADGSPDGVDAGDGGADAPCYTCSAAVAILTGSAAAHDPPERFCDGVSAQLFDDLMTCICVARVCESECQKYCTVEAKPTPAFPSECRSCAIAAAMSDGGQCPAAYQKCGDGD